MLFRSKEAAWTASLPEQQSTRSRGSSEQQPATAMAMARGILLSSALFASAAAVVTERKGSEHGAWLARDTTPQWEPTMADLLRSSGRGNLALTDMNSRAPVSVPEQGYAGREVYHTNMQSHTSDWTNEYGPGADAAKPSASQPKLLGFRSDARQDRKSVV